MGISARSRRARLDSGFPRDRRSRWVGLKSSTVTRTSSPNRHDHRGGRNGHFTSPSYESATKACKPSLTTKMLIKGARPPQSKWQRRPGSSDADSRGRLLGVIFLRNRSFSIDPRRLDPFDDFDVITNFLPTARAEHKPKVPDFPVNRGRRLPSNPFVRTGI